MPSLPHIRDAAVSDFDKIVQLNLASEHFLSALTRPRLTELHGQSAYHRVVCCAGEVSAFLLAMCEGVSYDSPNYRWFEAHYTRFLYIDRVVVAEQERGKGLGTLLYTDLFAWARRQGVPLVTCEIDVVPPNGKSRRFHEQYGFRQVGTQQVAGGAKTVSLLVLELV